jgi:hypothetical protein
LSSTLTALWTASAIGPIRALSLARESELLLAHTSQSVLALFNHAGAPQGQAKISELAASAISDDGAAVVTVVASRLAILAADLRPRWELQLGTRLTAVAIDSHGQYVAAGDHKGGLHLVNRDQQYLGGHQCPRSIHHLAFVPSAPYLACAGEFGWVGFFDLLRSEWAWSDRPVANISQLAVGISGDPVLLACFSEGIRSYGNLGGHRANLATPQPCGMVATAADGDIIVAAGQGRSLFVAKRGDSFSSLGTPHTPTAIALSAAGDRVYCGYSSGSIQCFELKM